MKHFALLAFALLTLPTTHAAAGTQKWVGIFGRDNAGTTKASFALSSLASGIPGTQIVTVNGIYLCKRDEETCAQRRGQLVGILERTMSRPDFVGFTAHISFEDGGRCDLVGELLPRSVSLDKPRIGSALVGTFSCDFPGATHIGSFAVQRRR